MKALAAHSVGLPALPQAGCHAAPALRGTPAFALLMGRHAARAASALPAPAAPAADVACQSGGLADLYQRMVRTLELVPATGSSGWRLTLLLQAEPVPGTRLCVSCQGACTELRFEPAAQAAAELLLSVSGRWSHLLSSRLQRCVAVRVLWPAAADARPSLAAHRRP